MALNTPFNASAPINETMGNISLLNPNYTGINWVRDRAIDSTGGDAASYILLGLLVGLFFMFVNIPNVSRYAAAIVSSFGTFLIGIAFFYWGFLPKEQSFILFILFMIFGLSCIGLYNQAKDEKESLQI